MKSLVSRTSTQWIIIAVITLLAAAIRLPNLGMANLANDEFLQFETAVGYLRTGEWGVRYDYYAEAIGKRYDRAPLFIVQEIASLKLFGEHEWAARLPAALWGIALVPIVMLVLLRVLKHDMTVYATGLVLAFDHMSIDLSRYVRMYSMVMVLAVLMVYGLYQALETNVWRKRAWYALLFSIATTISWLVFKELTLATLGGIGVYATIRAFAMLFRQQDSDRAWLWLWAAGVVIVSAAFVLTLFGGNIIPLKAAIVRIVPHWTYLGHLYDSWSFPWLAGALGVLGLMLAWRHLRSFPALVGTISVVALAYFVFFSNRWDAQRYISMVQPWVILITVMGAVATLRFLFELMPKVNWFRYGLLLVVIMMAGPWYNIAYGDSENVDMRTAYQYVVEHYQPGEVVLMQGPRFFYWPDDTIPVRKMGAYESLSLNQFKTMAMSSSVGGWVIYNEGHQRHLRDELERMLNKRFDYVAELADTGVYVYHFTPDEVPPLTVK